MRFRSIAEWQGTPAKKHEWDTGGRRRKYAETILVIKQGLINHRNYFTLDYPFTDEAQTALFNLLKLTCYVKHQQV
jgi:hypothetical protein